jgi:hypothetical protein
VPGCPQTRQTGAYCVRHARSADTARGRRQTRGYDATHDAIRRRLLAQLRINEAAGAPPPLCARCEQPLTSDQNLDAGHSQDLRVNPAARADRLEHAVCNRAWRKA